MCVNPKVKKATSSSKDINFDCNKLNKDRKCKFRNNLEGFTPPANEGCGTGNESQPVMDMEDLVSMGNERKVCPFYYTRGKVAKADLVLMPYNYLFDKEAKESTLQEIDWKNAVVIFDEAHNLEGFASESASFDLTTAQIAGCANDMGRVASYLQASEDPSHSLKRENLLSMKRLFLDLVDYIDNLNQQSAYAGEFMMEIFRRGKITHANHMILIEEVNKVNEYLMDMKGASRGSVHFEHLVQCLKRVYSHSLESRCLAKAAFYRVYVSPKQNVNHQTARTVSYWCFAPSLAMEELVAKSVIVTSGTLAPLQGLIMELGMKFPHTLENPHIVSEKQIHVRVIGKGVSGKVLSSSYERRKHGEYYSELGNTLVSLAKVTPAGMLIFFPSYGVMESCIERWGGPSASSNSRGGDKVNDFFVRREKKQSNNKYVFPCAPTIYYDENAPRTPWKRLIGTKSVVVEPRASADLPDAISEFQRLLGLPKSRGCILMGVCRGKISEGIDFAHEQSRAVVITGLPFPPTHDPKIKMKKEYLDCARAQHSIKPSGGAGFKGEAMHTTADMLTGHQWYTQQAHRAVNQAIGRVIRNRTDYGAVILLDDRFGLSHNQDGLSKWLRPHIKNDEGFGAAVRGLVTFYKEADTKAREIAKEEANTKHVVLEYEDDEDEAFTKIAVVRRPDENVSNLVEHVNTSTRDYLGPADVVSRIDMSHCEKNKPASEPELQVDVKTTFQPNFDAIFQAQQPQHTVNESKNVALLFFQKAKKIFSESELASVKKSIVAMKAYDDKRDSRSYVDAARNIIQLILQREHPEAGTSKGDTLILMMFFDLQSPFYKEQVQRLAMRMVFETSNLSRLCVKHLPDPQYRLAHSYMMSLLLHVWCIRAQSDEPSQTFVGKSKDVLTMLLKADKLFSSTLVQAFLKLMPAETLVEAQTLVNQLSAFVEVERMKLLDKSLKGESTVNEMRFKQAPANCKMEPIAASKKKVDLQMEPPMKRPREGSIASSTRNPYAKSKPPPTKTLSTSDIEKKDTATHDIARRESSALSSVLKKVEDAGTYVPSTTTASKTAKHLQKRMNAKLSANLSCPVCASAGVDEPFIAECGHVACLACWKSWLGRSSTCPTCRRPACKETLARVVFESHSTNISEKLEAGASETHTNNDESSDEELEITYS